MKKINKIILLSLVTLFSHLSAQARMSNRDQSQLIRQYGFSFYTVADSKSDSIRVLSYLSVPNNVLQFIKNDQNFEAAYEATLSIKEKKGSQLGRKNWVNTLVTNEYLALLDMYFYKRNLST